ncbi:histone H3-K79 methyltransferase [Phytophthora cactorum]|nr:histone H3-K79 methyltransferase [Phytophthora cactorum]
MYHLRPTGETEWCISCTPSQAAASSSGSQAERAIREIFSSVSTADVRQQAGKTDENAGEMLPAAVSSVIQMIGNVHQDNVFLDIGAGLGNVAAQFAIQTNARQSLGIEKRLEVVRRGVLCLRPDAARKLLLHKVILRQGDVLDKPLSSRSPFQGTSIVSLNDFLFDETAKLVVHEELYLMPSTASRFLSKEILLQMEARENHVWTRKLKSRPIPIYMYATLQ